MKENRVYKMAIDELMNEAYDMQEDYSNETIASTVQRIVAELNNAKGDDVEVDLEGATVKVRNAKHWSFISVSVGEFTGLSESVAEITDLSMPIDEDGVKKIIEMINEAWYQAVS